MTKVRPRGYLCLIAFALLDVSITSLSAGDMPLQSPSAFETDETREHLERLRVEEPGLAGAVEKALEGLGEDGPDASGSRRTMRSTRREGAARRIVNGIGTFRWPAAGALLKGGDRNTAGPWCSGTLIGCDTFLTAAHCIEKDPTPGNYLVFFQNAGFFAVTDIRWPKETFKFPYADVAVLTLSRPVEGIAPIALNRAASPVNGSDGTIVGFGRTGGANLDYGLKREGSIRTAACKGRFAGQKLLCWDFASQMEGLSRRSNTCNADSGGGLYLQDRNTLKVAGLTAGGSQSDCLTGDHSYDTDVFEHRDWIDATPDGEPGPAPMCGSLPPLDPDRHVKGAGIRLNEQRPVASFTFDVPAGVGALRVAMNGEDDGKGGNDFNLYLIPGEAADTAKAICAEEGSGQFAFCEVDRPSVRRWTIVARHVKGDGRAQIAVTLAPGSGPP